MRPILLPLHGRSLFGQAWELVRKLALTGFVLLIDNSRNLQRQFVAMMLSCLSCVVAAQLSAAEAFSRVEGIRKPERVSQTSLPHLGLEPRSLK